MQTRRYRPEDRASLIQLWKTIFPDDPPHNAPEAALEAKLKVDDLIFVVEHNDKLIAACMAGYDGHRGWLYAVGVLPEYRRQGVGEGLVQYALNELRELGCIKVNLQIRAGNVEVAAFYKKLGFAVEERLSMGVFID